MTHVVGIDPSLRATGIAHVYPDGGIITDTIASTGKAGATITERSARLIRLTTKILAHVGDAKLVVIEGPAYTRNNPGTFDRAGLWWHLVDALLARGYPLAVCPPSARAKLATGRGNAGKDEVMLATARRYPTAEVTNNDEADALILAAAGTHWLGHPLADLPKTNLTALNGIAWPDQEGLAA